MSTWPLRDLIVVVALAVLGIQTARLGIMVRKLRKRDSDCRCGKRDDE